MLALLVLVRKLLFPEGRGSSPTPSFGWGWADIGCAASFPSLLVVLLRPLISYVVTLSILRVGTKDGMDKLTTTLTVGVSRDAMVYLVGWGRSVAIGQINWRLGL